MALNSWKENLYQRYLTWSCRPSRIRRFLQGSLPARAVKKEFDRRRLRVAALQVKLALCQSPLGYAELVHRRVKEAVASEAVLVAFPEYHNLPLFGLLPGIEEMQEEYRQRLEAPQSEPVDPVKNKAGEISLTDLFRFMTPAVQPLIETVFSMLAAAYHIYIMAGSYTLAAGGSVVNRAFLFGPDGKLIGSQDKLHLLPVEAGWQLQRGKNLNSFDTGLGRLAMPICMDATYFETFRILENLKVEIALLPIANMEAYNFWLALRGIWPRVQESPIYGVKSALVGSIAGLTFSGRAGIFAPIELTPGRDGVLAEVEHYDREGIAVADLDLDALKELRLNHPWRDRNSALSGKYFPEIYTR